MALSSDEGVDLGLERRSTALAAAGIVGTYERDHRNHTIRLCRAAAELLAGDPDLASRDLTPAQALANVYTDDVSLVRDHMRRVASAPGVYVREHRVRASSHGVRHVLVRGRTYAGLDGRPSHTLGVVIDITEIEADGRQRHPSRVDALDEAAKYGIAAYEAIETAGLRGLLAPARALLMAIGRELGRRMTGSSRRLH